VISVLLMVAALAYVRYTQFVIEDITKERDEALVLVGQRDAQLETAESFNKSMSVAVETIKRAAYEEREAYKKAISLDRQTRADADKAVSEIRELLQNESKDDCGSRRLPQSVIDRMWVTYQSEIGTKAEGDHQDSD